MIRDPLRSAKRRRSKSGGFSLVEVMVASLILTIFLAGFLASYINAMKTQQMASRHYRAECVARNRIQRARSFDFASLHLLTESEVAVDEEGNESSLGSYRRSTSIDTNVQPHTVRVTVGVRYPLGTTSDRSEPVLMDTLISEQM